MSGEKACSIYEFSQRITGSSRLFTHGHICPTIPPPPTGGVRINGFVYNNKVEGRLLYWIFWVGALIRVYVTISHSAVPFER